MGNLNDYAAICQALDEVQNEEPKNALELLKEIEGMLASKIRSKKLGINPAEKELLLTVHLPPIKEKIEKALASSQKGAKKTKSHNSSKERVSPQDEDDYSYDFDTDNDEWDGLDNCPTWEDLNPDGLSYPNWLHEVGLREFFSLSHDCLYKVAACVCLVHSAAIPGTQRNLLTAAELPKILCYGKPLSGKSTFCNWVGNHYQTESDPDYHAFQTVMDSDSLKGLRDKIDHACNIGEGTLREACVHFDDFEPKFVLNGGIWSKSKGIFVAVTRNQATSRVSVNGNKERDAQSLFYSWALMLLSTNNHPKELFSQLSKMERRCIVLPFERIGTRSLGEFSWHNLRDEYKQIWTKGQIESVFWRGILRPLLRKPFSQFKHLQPDYISRSLTLMAVGIFTGIFQDEEEAEKHFATYWEYISAKTSEGYEDLLISALEDFIGELETTKESLVSKLGRTKRFVEVEYSRILEKVGGVSAMSPKEKENRILGYMRLRGYQPLQRVNSSGEYYNVFLKYLEL